MKIIPILAITLATSATAFVSSDGKATLCQIASDHLQKRSTKPFNLRLSSFSSPENLGGALPYFSKMQRGMRKSLALSPNERTINLYQLLLLFTIGGLIRIPDIANFVAKSLQSFPHYTMIKYEALSTLDWLVHYFVLVYNIGILQNLLWTDVDTSSKNKRVLAIVVAGLGHLFGITTMLSHSLIGTSSLAEQALHNFSHFSMAFSAMSIGGMLIFPVMLGIPSSFLVGLAIFTGEVSFQSVPGIVLCCLGILAVSLSSKKDFPVRFKIGYCMLAMNPLVAKLVNQFISPEADLAHTMVAAWILISVILQRSSLVERITCE